MILEFQGVEKSFNISPFRHKKVLHGLDLTVEEGASFGFIGPNGAGKSTAIKLLMNFLVPDAGNMFVRGKKVGKDEFRSEIGYLPEYPCFYNNLTAMETLVYLGRLSGIGNSLIISRGRELLQQVKLADVADQRISTFSKGMKQRLGLAASLIHDPQLLIFDEPMSGLDPVGRHLVKNIIKDLCEKGKTVFFSTHILADIDQLCDTIAVIHKGHLLYQGSLRSFEEGFAGLEEAFVENINKWDCVHAA